MAETTLAERLNLIIKELGIPKSDFARSIGISRDYIYLLTSANSRVKTPSRAVVMLIEKQYGYRAEWVMKGTPPIKNIPQELAEKLSGLDKDTLRKIEAQIDALKGGGKHE